MVFFIKMFRYIKRSNITMILVSVTIFMILYSFHLYQKDKNREKPQPVAQSSLAEKTLTDETRDTKVVKQDVTEEEPEESQNMFVKYSSDKHLRSLLHKQANSQGQVMITIVGGDSYSIFSWDWHERMLELSNDTNNCHCIIVAMDETAVVIAAKQNIPLYYSTFTYEQQMQWMNVIEVRQHSLYRVGYAKFDTTARIVRMGYSVMFSEMDVFWRKNPLDNLKQPLDAYDFQISHHYGAHPRVNIGLFFVRPTKLSVSFFAHAAEFWLRYGKCGFLSDQRALDALLNNYDKLDKTYLKAMPPLSLRLNWTTHDFGNVFAHFMTDGSAFLLFSRAAQHHMRSKKYYGESDSKFFTVNITDVNMTISRRNLIIRALLILQRTQLQNRTFIFPAFTSNITIVPIQYQLDIKKFLLYWGDDRVRLPEFLLLNESSQFPITTLPYTPKKTYEDVNGILNLTLDSIPLNLPAPSPQFEVEIRDSLLWCSPPTQGGSWCIHHPRDFGATMEILFSCVGDPYPPCANKTQRNEQFLERPYEDL